jgi:hypothetical protein
MNWNIREITDGKLHLNNIKREDCLNLKKSWKPHSKRGQGIYFHFIQHCVHRAWKRPSWSISHWPKMAPFPHFPDPDQQIFIASLGLILSTSLSSVLLFFITIWPYFWSIMDAKKFLQVINRQQTILVWFNDWMLGHRIVKCKVSKLQTSVLARQPIPYTYRYTAHSITLNNPTTS